MTELKIGNEDDTEFNHEDMSEQEHHEQVEEQESSNNVLESNVIAIDEKDNIETHEQVGTSEKSKNVNESCDKLNDCMSDLMTLMEKTTRDNLRDPDERNLCRDMEKGFGAEIHRLEQESKELLREIRDEQVKVQHEIVKRQITKCKKDIRLLEARHMEDVEARVKELHDGMNEKISDIVGEYGEDVDFYKKRLSGTITKRQLYEEVMGKGSEIVEMLKREISRLKSHLSSNVQVHEAAQSDPSLREALENINKIREDLERLGERIENVTGSRKDKEYLDLDHKLGNLQTRLDVIQVNNNDVVRRKRKDVVELLQLYQGNLEQNIVQR